ncbi:hypothetical protein [Paenibacillus glycanilyticus]|uniref:DUF2185 domain-containing protein n=1 Tax=Paenibacillus glycanilyticus TaxID=126569 RepID=A0ABQ6GAH5_9BACL|nr:hypothetical protein [Paenibacillus glycanilyticus]GLX67253.1 hypothetical protein MU1_15980 [Paenibacillus glycanilyticus]
MFKRKWAFEDPKSVAVMTMDKIMKRESPVLYVTHDEEDGMWQFLDGDDVIQEEARLISLKQMVDIDPGLIKLANLPFGWVAWRESKDSEWIREQR